MHLYRIRALSVVVPVVKQLTLGDDTTGEAKLAAHEPLYGVFKIAHILVSEAITVHGGG